MKTAMSVVSTVVYRFFWLAGIIAVAFAIIIAGSITVMSRSDVGVFPGTEAHDWYGTGGTTAHAAPSANCLDCHANKATELTHDAHAGLLGQFGETESDPSWRCKACHTKIDVDMTMTPRGPLKLHQGGP